MRPLIAVAALILLGASSPMTPFAGDAAPSAMVPGAPAPMTPNTYGGGGSFPPPATCSNKLDLSQACNSQYLGFM